ncbi:MAG: pyridoxal 5'-phosphate synthase glutaminase subunit PdxT [Clostridia bacterium]|nr:pyridoxal 5'-phosphate synthase glutaminase subunit PdxT [Clostridia bacterium]
MKIGVLALQGAFIEHREILKKLDADSFEIRSKEDLKQSFDGLIIPGGESTVQGKLLRELDMFNGVKDMIQDGLSVYGTCAGLLLLAKRIEGNERTHLEVMDITAVRNAYGRQLGSFFTEASFAGIKKIPMTFIRAPYVKEARGNAVVLATVEGKIVAVKQNNMLVTAFHPELNDDTTVHRYFLNMLK